MRSAFLLAVLAFAPAVAAAQQPCSSDADSAVDAIYRRVLERPAGGEGGVHAERLRTGQTTVRELVREIAKSPEHRQRFLSTNEANARVNAVTNLYRHLLARAPDPAGLNSHVQGLSRGDIDTVIDTMIDSPEYLQKFGQDTVPGEGRRYCRDGSGSAANTPPSRMRFRNMDRNGNGVIEREEWNGNPNSFDIQDWNNDNVLSGDELQPGARRAARSVDNRDTRFEALDVNRNERIERSEWQGSRDAFAWLDRNGDNVLTRSEVVGEGSGRFDSFTSLDADRDGTLRPDEWRWSTRVFEEYDTDSDGFLTRREFAMGGGAPTSAR
jgi:Ca2+-binding EF-hand superfamily protein